MALPWCLQSDCGSGADADNREECLACRNSFLVVLLSVSRVIQSPGARSQLLLCKLLLGPFCSHMEDALCQSLTLLGLEHANCTRVQRPVGRWETLCSRKSRERKRGQRPVPRGLYKLSHRLPEAQGLPAGRRWGKGLTPCPPVLRHAITLQVIKQATVPDMRSHMETEN